MGCSHTNRTFPLRNLTERVAATTGIIRCLGYRIFPYCFDMPHLIICARERCWGWACPRAIAAKYLDIHPYPGFLLTPAGWNLGGVCLSGEWAVGRPPCSTTPHAMTASSGHPDRRRGARSFTPMFLCCVWSSYFHHQSRCVSMCVKASSHFGIPSRVDMGSQLRPRMRWSSTCIQQVAECRHVVVHGTVALDLYLVQRLPWQCTLTSTLRHRRENTALLKTTVP